MRALTNTVISNIARAQQKQKELHDKKAKRIRFEVGDLVLLYTPRRISGKTFKLCRLYNGPYVVVRRFNSRNYMVKKLGRRPASLQVVHVNRMKKFHVRTQTE